MNNDNDIRAAMLGDHEAAKRLTEQGVLLPCPFCGREVALRRVCSSYASNPSTIRDKWTVECPKGCVNNNTYESNIFQDDKGVIIIQNNGAVEARLAWNIRMRL